MSANIVGRPQSGSNPLPDGGRFRLYGGQRLKAAIFATSGRSDGSRAALLASHGARLAGQVVRLVRAVLPGEPLLPIPGTEHVPVTQRECRTSDVVGFATDELARAGEDDVVVDLPGCCLNDVATLNTLDILVVAVGPTPLDEEAARAALVEVGPGTAPVWLLACGRPGGGAAANALARNLQPDWVARRVLPVATAPASRPEFAALLDGAPSPRDVLGAVALHGALARAAGIPERPGVDLDGLLKADRRHVDERLRDLADELAAIRDGNRPTAQDLENAPVLEDWEEIERTLPALRGRAFGHPNVRDGRLAETSDLYEIGPGWVLTLSRYWRLGRRRGEAGATAH